VKIVVDYDLCEANALCMRTAADIFQLDDQDKLHLLVEDVEGEQLEKAQLAVKRCPRRALSLR
jgi:ferredoxin